MVVVVVYGQRQVRVWSLCQAHAKLIVGAPDHSVPDLGPFSPPTNRHWHQGRCRRARSAPRYIIHLSGFEITSEQVEAIGWPIGWHFVAQLDGERRFSLPAMITTSIAVAIIVLVVVVVGGVSIAEVVVVIIQAPVTKSG